MDSECPGFFLGCVSTTPALRGVFSGCFSLKCYEIPGWGSATPRSPLALPAGPRTGWMVVSEGLHCTPEIHPGNAPWKFTLEIDHGKPSWKSTMENHYGSPLRKTTMENHPGNLHPGNPPQKSTTETPPGNAPWKSSTDFFLCKFSLNSIFLWKPPV